LSKKNRNDLQTPYFKKRLTQSLFDSIIEMTNQLPIHNNNNDIIYLSNRNSSSITNTVTITNSENILNNDKDIVMFKPRECSISNTITQCSKDEISRVPTLSIITKLRSF